MKKISDQKTLYKVLSDRRRMQHMAIKSPRDEIEGTNEKNPTIIDLQREMASTRAHLIKKIRVNNNDRFTRETMLSDRAKQSQSLLDKPHNTISGTSIGNDRLEVKYERYSNTKQ